MLFFLWLFTSCQTSAKCFFCHLLRLVALVLFSRCPNIFHSRLKNTSVSHELTFLRAAGKFRDNFFWEGEWWEEEQRYEDFFLFGEWTQARRVYTHTYYRYKYTKTKHVKTVSNYIISQWTGAHIDTHAKDKTPWLEFISLLIKATVPSPWQNSLFAWHSLIEGRDIPINLQSTITAIHTSRPEACW